MAQVSSGSFVTNASEGRSLTFSWSVDSTSIAENYTNIYWTVKGSGSYTGYVYAGDFNVVIDGETVYNSSTRIQLWQGTVVASGYKKIYHDTYGNKQFTASVKSSIYEYAVDNTGSGSWDLPTIPRYATVSLSLNSKTESSITINWSSDSLIDCMWVSIDGGASFGTGFYREATSGSHTISGLNSNTTYKIRIQVRRKDSQLGTNSDVLSVTTESYPYCSKSNDFTIGDNVQLTIHNPLKRSCDIYFELADGTVMLWREGVTGTGLSLTPSSSAQNSFYKSIPNAQSGRYKVRVVYNGKTMTRNAGNTYKIRGDEVPTLGEFSYKDNKSATVSVTGNNQHIVQNNSTVIAVVGTATVNKFAGGIAKYKVECNGKALEKTSSGNFDIGTIDSARDVDLKLTVTDTRGLTSSKTIKVTMLSHAKPNAIVTLERLNNYEDESYLTVDGSVSSLNSKNTMAIKYRYKLSGGSYGSYTTIGDRQKQTLSLDKQNAYIFEVTVTDALGSSFIAEYVLNKGKFPLFVDTKNNAVGINEFPSVGEALRVKDGIANFEDGVKISGGVIGDFVVEQGTTTNWSYRKWNSGVAECWGTAKYTASTSLASGDNFQFTVPYPVVFTEKPVSFIGTRGDGMAYQVKKCYPLFPTDKDNAKNITIWAVLESSVSANNTVTFNVHTSGRWK